MMIPVMMRAALYDIVSVADPRHLFFVVDGHQGNGDDDRHDDGGCI